MRCDLIIALMLMLVFGASAQSKMQTTDKNATTGADAAGVTVDLETTMGPIRIRLYDDTPAHRDNFVKLVKEGYYDGMLFHRVINDFMVQTGDPQSKEARPGQSLGASDPDYTLPAEINYPKHYHKYGAVAAARTGDRFNPERRSSGSQFYIVTGNKYTPAQLEGMAEQAAMRKRNDMYRGLVEKNAKEIEELRARGDQEGLNALRDKIIYEVENAIPVVPLPSDITEAYTTVGGTPHLDGQYTVFGEVVSGMDTVEKIQKAETDRNDRPLEDIRIVKAVIAK